MNVIDTIRDIDIHIDEELRKKFDLYCDFLLSENEKYNLTAITDVTEVWTKHFADSMLGSFAVPEGAAVCDVGCGAGFPSIPLKLIRDDISVTLVDSLAKRIEFCKKLCAQLQVKADFFHERAEDFAANFSERFDVATARAVAPLNVLLEYTAQTVKIGGSIVAYKTDLSELDGAANACKTLGLRFETHRAFTLADGSRRSILVFRKTAHTPKKYPRRQNKPRKQPL